MYKNANKIDTLVAASRVHSPQELQQNTHIICAIYLTLSFVSGLIELGSVIYAVRLGAPTYVAISFGLAYQLGALCQNPLTLTGLQYRSIVVMAAFCAISALWEERLIWVTVLLLSAGLQGIREEAIQHVRVATLPKRLARILGFTASGVFNNFSLPLLCVTVIVLSVALHRNQSPVERASQPVPSRSLNIFALAMVVHQMHYFTYAYALPVLFLQSGGLNPFAAGLAFSLGWISYSLAPSVLQRLPHQQVIIVGHVAVAITLLFIAQTYDNLRLILTAWFISGFGGGTVFAIRKLSDKWARTDTTHALDLWENVGHVLGVLLALVLFFLLSSVKLLFLTAAALATLVALIFLMTKTSHPSYVD